MRPQPESEEAAGAPRTPFDLGRVLGDTAAFVRSRREFGRIQFETKLPEEPLLVTGNPVMIGQVATNLLLNACEAQPEGGSVAVVARREGERVVAEVQDRGPGVKAADRERIFEPYARRDTHTARGSGIGLYAAKRLGESMGARLWCEPAHPHGARFVVALPAAVSI